MKKILILAGKELLSTLRQRNLVLLMFLSPIVLSTIIGLAFGGLGGASGTPDFADIRVAARRDSPFTTADCYIRRRGERGL